MFDVPTTTMPHEYQQHRGPVVEILFDPVNGERLWCGLGWPHMRLRRYARIPACKDDRLVTTSEHVSMCISPDGGLLASVGPDPLMRHYL